MLLVSAVVALAAQGSAATYTLYMPEGRRTLPYRPVSGVDLVSLDQLAALFKLTVTEDTLVGGLTVQGRGTTVLLIPGQSFASVGPGKIVSLPAAVQRDRGNWQVPVDFIRLVLGPAFGQRVEVRQSTRTILVGDVRLPAVTGRFERIGPNARLTFDIQPPAPHRIVREGNRLMVRFDAVALEFAPPQGLESEFASGVRADGTTVVVELGSSVGGYRADDPDQNRLVIDLAAKAAPPPPPPPPAAAAAPSRPQGLPTSDPLAPPIIETQPAGSVRTVVIDPGHGGPDEGAHGPGGMKEKDFVLQMARRIKSAIENRIGLRVLLTRENDEAVPLERRAAIANNNKADLYFSLHANASIQPSARGVQVLSLSAPDYKGRVEPGDTRDVPVPVVGGGSRIIDVVPWDFAQLPFAEKSGTLATILSRRLAEQRVPLYAKAVQQLPLRTLVGANMPAVMIEMGFLTNAAEEKALSGPELSGNIADAVIATIEEVRRGIPAAAAGGRP